MEILVQRQDPIAAMAIKEILAVKDRDALPRLEKVIELSERFFQSANPLMIESMGGMAVMYLGQIFESPQSLMAVLKDETGATRLRDVLHKAASIDAPKSSKEISKPASANILGLVEKIDKAEALIKTFSEPQPV